MAVVALALERVAYAVIWHRPDLFARACRRVAPAHDPVDLLAALFVGFKGLQALVFAGWWVAHGGSLRPASDGGTSLLVGGALVGIGQALNMSVFARLGRTGVFYGSRLGHDIPWCRGFPFSVVRHPQYVGTVLTIWGIFVVMRYPAPDWIALPLLETLYYTLGALVEQVPPTAGTITAATGAAPRASEPLG